MVVNASYVNELSDYYRSKLKQYTQHESRRVPLTQTPDLHTRHMKHKNKYINIF
jgi:hypothetical protein